MKYLLRTSFVGGFVFTVSLYTFIQDWMGLEAFVQFAKDNWEYMSPGWGFLGMFVGLCIHSIACKLSETTPSESL
ncbi:hypothetical protein LCGC14_0145840 [marine sediment metagenome]|uniref:Uncharacterized protein n=1 Tax=marine sediment metagenome TaxID=412755 RepID=A0A0F9Y1C7_9ZZZZ